MSRSVISPYPLTTNPSALKPTRSSENPQNSASFSLEKPPLPSPKNPSLMRSLLKAHLKHEKQLSDYAKTALQGFNREMERYLKAANELAEAQKELEDNQEKTKALQFITDAMGCMLDTLSFLAGIALVMDGGENAFYGQVMLGAAVAGGANRAIGGSGWEGLAKTLTNDEEKQKKLAQGLQVSADVLMNMSSILAGLLCAQNTQLANLPDQMERFLKNLLSVARLGTEPRKMQAEAAKRRSHVKVLKQDNQMQLTSIEISQRLEEVNKTADAEGAANEIIARLVRTIEEMCNRIANIR